MIKGIPILLLTALLAVSVAGCGSIAGGGGDAQPTSVSAVQESTETAEGVLSTTASDATEDAAADAPVLCILQINEGALSPAFDPDIMSYTVTVARRTETVILSAAAGQPGSADVTVHYEFPAGTQALVSGGDIAVTLNDDAAQVQIITENKITKDQRIYTVTFIHEPSALSGDLKLVSDLLGRTREEAVSMLGDGYTIIATGGEGWCEGYYYADKGLTLSFYPEDMEADPQYGIYEQDLNRVLDVWCDEKVDINGARVGMTLDQLISALGEPVQVVYANEYYPVDVVFFQIEDLSVSFRMGGDHYTADLAVISRRT